MYAPDVCKGCTNHCCSRPQLTNDEYMLMWQHVGNDKLQSCEPHWLKTHSVWMFSHGCPASTPEGCLIPYKWRPLVCRLYPWIKISVYSDKQEEPHDELLLNAGRCPQWEVFGEAYEAAMQEMKNG